MEATKFEYKLQKDLTSHKIYQLIFLHLIAIHRL